MDFKLLAVLGIGGVAAYMIFRRPAPAPVAYTPAGSYPPGFSPSSNPQGGMLGYNPYVNPNMSVPPVPPPRSSGADIASSVVTGLSNLGASLITATQQAGLWKPNGGATGSNAYGGGTTTNADGSGALTDSKLSSAGAAGINTHYGEKSGGLNLTPPSLD